MLSVERTVCEESVDSVSASSKLPGLCHSEEMGVLWLVLEGRGSCVLFIYLGETFNQHSTRKYPGTASLPRLNCSTIVLFPLKSSVFRQVGLLHRKGPLPGDTGRSSREGRLSHSVRLAFALLQGPILAPIFWYIYA